MLVLYCYLNMPTINKTYLILSYLSAKVNENPGVWSKGMVAVNLFQAHISIYTSILERPVENIRSDMVLDKAKIPVNSQV